MIFPELAVKESCRVISLLGICFCTKHVQQVQENKIRVSFAIMFSLVQALHLQAVISFFTGVLYKEFLLLIRCGVFFFWT